MRITPAHQSTALAAAGGKPAAEGDADFSALLAAALPEAASLPSELPLSVTAQAPDASLPAQPAPADGAAQPALPDPAAQILLLVPSLPALPAAPRDAGAGQQDGEPAAAVIGTSAASLPALAASAHLAARPDSRGQEPSTQPAATAERAAALPAAAAGTATAASPAFTLSQRDAVRAADRDPAPSTLVAGASGSAGVAAELPPARAVMHVAAPLSSSRWEQAFGERVLWAAQKDLQSASLTLNPPELGPVKIELHVSEAQAIASFSSHQPEVRKAIEDALPALKALFADAGLQLQQANVGGGDARQSQAREQDGTQARSSARAGESTDSGSAPMAPPARQSNRLLDTFA